jgi:arylsulfatase A-like enzyme
MILSPAVPTIPNVLVKKGYRTAAFGKLHHQFNTAPYRMHDKSAESFHDWVFPKGKNYPVREHFPIPYYGYQEVECIIGHGACLTGHYLEWLEERNPQLAKNMVERWKNIDNFFSVFCEHKIPVELYSSAYVTERTIAFLERHSRGEYGKAPFYIHCSFPDPHQSVYPPGKYLHMYNPEKMELPKNFHDIENLRNHPYLSQYINVMPGAMLRETNEEELRKFIAYTYGTITLMDHSIGQILASLDKLGYVKNTIVVYTSDHGDLMGEHGLLFKGPSAYMGVFHIPMIWKVPGLTKPSITNALMSSIDYPKTLLNVLGISEKKQPPDMQGCDLTPVLEKPNNLTIEPRQYCIIENDEEVGPVYARLRHIITKEYKMTVYEGYENYGDLFDIKNDPEELHNLWFQDTYKGIKLELLNKLLQGCLKVQSRYPKRLAGT